MQLCTLYLVYLYLNVAVIVSSIVCLVLFFPVNHCSKVPFFCNLSFPPFKGVRHGKRNVVLQYAILFNVSMSTWKSINLCRKLTCGLLVQLLLVHFQATSLTEFCPSSGGQREGIDRALVCTSNIHLDAK